MTQSPHVAEPDERYSRLYALMHSLQAHGFGTDLGDDRVLSVRSPQTPDRVIEVRCAHRHADGGRLWYLVGEGRPVAEAHDIAGALTELKGLLAGS